MRIFWQRLVLLLLLNIICLPTFAMSKITFVGAVYFEENSDVISFDGGKLDDFVCRANALNLEVVIIVGHADWDEKNPQELSLRRAEAVKQLLSEQGIPPRVKLFVEAKGTTWLSYLKNKSARKNRVVELEGIGTRGRTDQPACNRSIANNLWHLETETAIRIAHALVNDQMISPSEPAATAISSGRLDVLDRLLDGADRILLDADSRVRLMNAALVSGDQQYIERLISFGIRAEEYGELNRPIDILVCDVLPQTVFEDQQIVLIDILMDWGARPIATKYDSIGVREYRAVDCALKNNRRKLAERLSRDQNSDCGQKIVWDVNSFKENCHWEYSH